MTATKKVAIDSGKSKFFDLNQAARRKIVMPPDVAIISNDDTIARAVALTRIEPSAF